jgi:hypothetical protein
MLYIIGTDSSLTIIPAREISGDRLQKAQRLGD